MIFIDLACVTTLLLFFPSWTSRLMMLGRKLRCYIHGLYLKQSSRLHILRGLTFGQTTYLFFFFYIPYLRRMVSHYHLSEWYITKVNVLHWMLGRMDFIYCILKRNEKSSIHGRKKLEPNNSHNRKLWRRGGSTWL